MTPEDYSDNWDAPVEIGERIMDLLSGRIYRSLPIAIKELISNAWDADADNVKVNIDQERRAITISDDGSGMTKEKLRGYTSIAISDKSVVNKTPRGRPYIGSFGIGVYSALAFCRKVIVETKTENSSLIHHLDIETKEWMDEEGRRVPPSDKKIAHKFPGYTTRDMQRYAEHGTTITINGIFSEDWKQLVASQERDSSGLARTGIENMRNYLCQSAPIEYHQNAHPYSDFFQAPTGYAQMNLFFNGEKLFRNSVMCSDGMAPRILDQNEWCEIAGGSIICKYLIISPLKDVIPREMGGLQKRMQNVAIGAPEFFDVFEKSPKLRGRMRYIAGEICIIKGLENQLELDRNAVILCPEYMIMREFFKEKLEEMAKKLELYAEVERDVGALAYMEKVPPEKAKYGFLAEGAVREGTKRKAAKKAKSKEKLVADIERKLLRLGYSIKRVKTGETENKITVDHEKKTFTFVWDGEDDSSGQPKKQTGTITTGGGVGGTGGGPSGTGGTNVTKPRAPSPPKVGIFFEDIDAEKLGRSANEVNLLVTLNELYGMSVNKIERKRAFQEAPISAAMLMRSAYEQALLLLIKKAKLMKEYTDEQQTKGGKHTDIIKLSELEDFFSRKKDMPMFTGEIRQSFASVERLEFRQILNDVVHSPGKAKVTASRVEDLCAGGLLYFIQEVIDFNPK